nr:MAG TPA: hypothetical protein [Caudoviricetes sp.]
MLIVIFLRFLLIGKVATSHRMSKWDSCQCQRQY